MAILDVSKCSAFKPTADVTVTAPDGNTYVATPETWWGVVYSSTVLTIDDANIGVDVLLMEAGSHLKRSSGSYVPVGTVDRIGTVEA